MRLLWYNKNHKNLYKIYVYLFILIKGVCKFEYYKLRT